ncbi:MAG: hypothetical protein AAF449_14925 [Myxococcota bacterium]
MMKTLFTITFGALLFGCAATTGSVAKQINAPAAETELACKKERKFRASGSILPWGGTEHPHIRPPVVIIGVSDKYRNTDLRGKLAAHQAGIPAQQECPKMH